MSFCNGENIRFCHGFRACANCRHSGITNDPARLGCAEPPWTFAIGFARRDPAAPPVQGTTSHPTGCRRGQIGRILRAARPPVAIQPKIGYAKTSLAELVS